MSLIHKSRACLLTFIIILCSFSIIFNSSTSVLAEDIPEDSIDEIIKYLKLLGFDYDNVLTPHPYRFVGNWQFLANETIDEITIDGDIEFELFFSSTIFTQMELLNFKDIVNLSIYIKRIDKTPELIENGETSFTLEPVFLGDQIQEVNIKIEDLYVNLSDGDSLIFSLEIDYSDKPINSYVEKRFDTKVKPRLQKISNLLKKTENSDAIEVAGYIDMLLTNLSSFGIQGEEFGQLANAMRSSAFVYGNDIYNSNIQFKSIDNISKTLYFLNEIDYSFDSEFNDLLGFIKVINESAPTTDIINSYPPVVLDIEDISSTFSEESDFFTWIINWLLYTIGESEDIDEDFTKYYLTNDNKLITQMPEDDTSRITLSENTISWETETFSRNKIIEKATADLFIYHPKLLTLSKINVNASLYEDDSLIKTMDKQINRSSIGEIIQRGPDTPMLFDFGISDYEILNGHKIKLVLSVSGLPLISLKKPILLCNSIDYPSVLKLELEETENINISFDNSVEQYVVPGGSTIFKLNISSKYNDKININAHPEDEDYQEKWKIELPNQIEIAADDYSVIDVKVTSLDDTSNAENDDIEIDLEVIGKTGYDTKEVEVEVSEKAVEYSIDVVIEPVELEVKHGNTAEFAVTVKNMNTGIWEDNYDIEVVTEHDWESETSVENNYLRDIKPGEEVLFNLNISVPAYTDISSENIQLIIKSKNSIDFEKNYSRAVNATINVIVANIFEQFYHFFENVAESIGLDDALGDSAAAVLISLILLLIIFFLLIAVVIIKKKYILLICFNRIKEITPDEEAKFEVKIKNPSRSTLTYKMKTELNSSSESWDLDLDLEDIVIEPNQSKTININVKPTDFVKPEDWAEVKIIGKAVERNKTAEITLVTTVKKASPKLKISGVFHWPKIFKKSEKIETSFRVSNNGTASAENVTIILYVNGEEKNKVTDISIPRGAYAEIEMPWIAEKGKNEINIVVK